MLETSQDLFYIILSIAVLWFTIFLCFALYQIARMVKNANKVVETLTEKLEMINEAVDTVRNSLDGLTGKMGLVSTMLAGLVEKVIVGKIQRAMSGNTESKKRSSKVKKQIKVK